MVINNWIINNIYIMVYCKDMKIKEYSEENGNNLEI